MLQLNADRRRPSRNVVNVYVLTMVHRHHLTSATLLIYSFTFKSVLQHLRFVCGKTSTQSIFQSTFFTFDRLTPKQRRTIYCSVTNNTAPSLKRCDSL